MIRTKILVVDDTAISRYATALVIEQFGFLVDHAASGAEALRLHEASQYALIIMDYKMPEMSGFECTAKIRETENGTERRTPIICMSSSSRLDMRAACLAAGLDDYVYKGCAKEQLQAVVLKWIEATDHEA